MKAVLPSTLLLVLLATLGACSPNRDLDTDTPTPPHYCPCEIPAPPPEKVQPNLF